MTFLVTTLLKCDYPCLSFSLSYHSITCKTMVSTCNISFPEHKPTQFFSDTSLLPYYVERRFKFSLNSVLITLPKNRKIANRSKTNKGWPQKKSLSLLHITKKKASASHASGWGKQRGQLQVRTRKQASSTQAGEADEALGKWCRVVSNLIQGGD